MPDAELLEIQEVTLTVSLEEILSKDGYRVNCDLCGEEIINQREVIQDGLTLCRACAGEWYYRHTDESMAVLLADFFRLAIEDTLLSQTQNNHR
jgi:hypothetical protein